MKRKVSVVVGEDHLAGFKRSPRLAISELIWNALDADATDVKVDFELTLMDSIDTVTFRDNGTGMTDADAEFAFRNFGNSWKRSAAQTLGGRKLHGKLGRGRYTAFAIGTYPKWVSVAVDEGSRKDHDRSGTSQSEELRDRVSTGPGRRASGHHTDDRQPYG